MANRLNLTHALLMLLLATSCLAREHSLEACNVDESLSAFLGEDGNWEVLREPGAFSPILGLKVFESELWVSTYGADFFPVKVKTASNSVLIENIRFLRPAPTRTENDPAELVKQYATEDIVFTIPLAPSHCDIRDKLNIDVTNSNGENKVSLTFVSI